MLRWTHLAGILLAAVFAAAHPLFAAETAIDSIDALWAGFDPRTTPLEVEVVKAWDEEGVHLEMLYFTGEIFEGEKTRVFAYLGRPKAAADKLSGVLHIHGGGQTANLDWARFWAKRDYACVSFDFCGNTNQPHLGPEYRRERYTLWGKVPADMVLVGGGTKMLPTPRHNPWYHWALTARRGLTLLEAQPDVNPDRLGIFGVSVGGTLCWTVAGVDSRVKAAVPIYGCGWEFYPYPPDLDAPASDELKLWRKLIAPEAHAGRITCPVLSTDWNWVPAYTDPNREGTTFFSPWEDPSGERGFTLDPAMFPREREAAFYFGTRKIGDPQFNGVGRTVLLLDYLAEQTPESLTVRLSHRLPRQYAVEFTAKVLPTHAGGEPSTKGWRTLRMEASHFKGPDDKPLPGWDHVENFILHGTSAAGKPPVFKRLRWGE